MGVGFCFLVCCLAMYFMVTHPLTTAGILTALLIIKVAIRLIPSAQDTTETVDE